LLWNRLLVQRRRYRLLLLLLLLLLSKLGLILQWRVCRPHLKAGLLLRDLNVGAEVCRLRLSLSEWLTRLHHRCLLQHRSGEGLDWIDRNGR
jgi:hypothetical protein